MRDKRSATYLEALARKKADEALAFKTMLGAMTVKCAYCGVPGSKQRLAVVHDAPMCRSCAESHGWLSNYMEQAFKDPEPHKGTVPKVETPKPQSFGGWS